MHHLDFFTVFAIAPEIHMQEALILFQVPPERPVDFKLPFNVENMAPEIKKPPLELCLAHPLLLSSLFTVIVDILSSFMNFSLIY